MFSNVNEVVQQIYLAKIGGYRFVVDWSHSCYLDPMREGDPWLYYFLPCFDTELSSVQPPSFLPSGANVACSRDNIITPRLWDGECVPLLRPKNRFVPNKLIREHLRLRPEIAARIEEFDRANFSNKRIIGLHIRGPGRTDGGTSTLRAWYVREHGVPFAEYFNAVDRQLNLQPDAAIFVCSDSQRVMNEILGRYGSRIISYPAARSEFGEMHAGHPNNFGQSFSPYKLGEDVIVEAFLLSKADYFIHGNSNVANFILCNNPELKAEYVYQGAEKEIFGSDNWINLAFLRLKRFTEKVSRFGRR